MEYKTVKMKKSAVDIEERTFTGYASVFGNVDFQGDIVVNGAFRKTISERGDRIKVMYNHSWVIGKALELEETNKGLFVKGYISKTKMGDDVLTLINDGAVDEMSIGYEPIQWEMVDREGAETRLLKEIKLYEFSPVDFAANDLAVVTGVKNIAMARGVDIDDDQIRKALKFIDSMKDEPEEPLVDGDYQSIVECIAEAKSWAEFRIIATKLNLI